MSGMQDHLIEESAWLEAQDRYKEELTSLRQENERLTKTLDWVMEYGKRYSNNFSIPGPAKDMGLQAREALKDKQGGENEI